MSRSRGLEITTRSVLLYAALAFGACCLIWIGLTGAIYLKFETWQERGLAGDMFGAVNALFSGLALTGIVVAMFLQRQQLDIQKQDLQATQQELRLAEESQKVSEQLLARQADAISHAAQLVSITTLIKIYQDRIRLTRSPALEAEYGQRVEELTRSLQQLLEGITPR